jgi:excisionase family DNA binding protein
MKRRIITVEIDRVVLISKHESRPIVWCAACASRVEMVTVDEAARSARARARTIYRLVEAGRLHFTETPEGRLFICPNSLSRNTLEAETKEGEI